MPTRYKRKTPKLPRKGTKAGQVIVMLQKGWTPLKAIAGKMRWEEHTTRSFLSTLEAKHGIKTEARDGDAGREHRAI